MYHILGFVAFILGVVFIWAAGNYNSRLGEYFQGIYASVIAFFMAGLIMLAKRFFRKSDEQENVRKRAGESGEEEGTTDSSGEDLYLVSKWDDDAIRYRVENEEKEAVFNAVGEVNNGRLHSLKIHCREAVAGAVFLINRENGAKRYTVREGEAVLGTIMARKEGLDFIDVDNNVLYTAGFMAETISEEEEAIEGIMTLVTLTPHSGWGKADILLIKGPGDEVVGKYFFPLRNLELTLDKNNATDRRIAVILVIMADARLKIKKSRNSA